MREVFVAAGMRLPSDTRIHEDARRIGRLLAEHNYTLVQGGCDLGLMGLTLREYQKKSDKAILIVPRAYQNDITGMLYHKAYVVKSEIDRLIKAVTMSEVLVVFPGGSGTLEECLYFNETARAGEHQKPVFVCNLYGFFDPMFKMLEAGFKNGTINPEHIHLRQVKSVDELIEKMNLVI